MKKFRLRIVTVLICTAAGFANAQCTGRPELNNYERAQFVEGSIGHRSEVLAQFLAAPGCGDLMLQGLRSLGATVRYADERSGYALVLISKGRLLDTVDIPGIAYAYTQDSDRMYYQDSVAKILQSERKAEVVPQIVLPYPRVATTLPKDGPYFAADEMGLTELWKEHPQADGRGVRVAISDLGLDLLHPELQQARDTAGRIVPKIADLGTLTSPEEDSGWVRFGESIRAKDGAFEAGGRTWIAPEDGNYRLGIFKQNLVLGQEGNSLAKKISLSVGVLWDQQNNRVWVDTAGDGNFRNHRPLGDFGATHDINWFGIQEADNDNRIPFGVKMDPVQNAVYIRIGGDHGAIDAGSLAGNRLTGGLFDGSSPSAQLIDDQLTPVTSIASIVRMSARPDVSVINRSGGADLAIYAGKQEGSTDFALHVLERVIAVYNKPIACYCAAAGTIDVNDYAGPEMLRRNRQLGPPYRETLGGGTMWFAPDGLVNAVLAPSANLGAQSRYKPYSLRGADGKWRSYFDDAFAPPAPNGYWINSNMSPTIPVVSGMLADLISEAKQEQVRYDAARLNNAVFTGTRLLDGFPLSQQGYGLINAAQSWDQLAKMAKADDPATPELTSFSVSYMKGGHRVEVQGFHAELARVGEKLQGEVWITRHGGYPGERRYTFALRGNNGSYELLDREAMLKRDLPVRVRFRTNGVSGWNIVFLELRDVIADVVMQDVPLSVRVPDRPETLSPGVDKYRSTIQPLRSEYRYIRVGEEVQAARYVMQIPYAGPAEDVSTRYFPGFAFGRYRTTKTPPGEPLDAAHHVGPMETLESLVMNNEPGTQTIFWENYGRPEYATQYDDPAPDVPINAELTVTKYAVAIAKTRPETLSVANELANVKGHIELYAAKLAVSELKGLGNHAMADVERALPANLIQWRVRVTSSSKGEHIDAYLFNCTGKNDCNVVSQQEITGDGTSLVVDRPQPGMWKIIVRSRKQMARGSTYKLSEAQLTAAQTGTVEADVGHSSGEKWSVALPDTAQYAAFRIAGTPGEEREKNGLLIAMTPLVRNAP